MLGDFRITLAHPARPFEDGARLGQRVIAEFGIGLASAVFLDAFILRTILVPAVMHMIGDRNWWLPRRLDRVLPRVAVEGAES